MIPVFLNDLSLDSALSSYCVNVGHYIQTSNRNEHVVDLVGRGISCFVNGTIGQTEDEEQKFFAVDTPKNKDFALLQLDHGMLPDTISKCDCAIVDDADCSFVEFKANATSTNTKTVRGNYRKAMRQLTKTIRLFRDESVNIGKDFDSLRHLEAFICFRRGYPQHTASEANYRVTFWDENHVELSFEPKKILN